MLATIAAALVLISIVVVLIALLIRADKNDQEKMRARRAEIARKAKLDLETYKRFRGIK